MNNVVQSRIAVRGTGCGPLKKRRPDDFAPDADLIRQANALLGVGVRKADLPKLRKPRKLTRFDLVGAETTHKPMREY